MENTIEHDLALLTISVEDVAYVRCQYALQKNNKVVSNSIRKRLEELELKERSNIDSFTEKYKVSEEKMEEFRSNVASKAIELYSLDRKIEKIEATVRQMKEDFLKGESK